MSSKMITVEKVIGGKVVLKSIPEKGLSFANKEGWQETKQKGKDPAKTQSSTSLSQSN